MRVIWVLTIFCMFNISVSLTSCVRAPKRPQSVTDVPSAVQGELPSTGVKANPDETIPTATDSLALLHADQKSCVSCHEKSRPAPPHIVKEDCASCHSFPSFKTVKAFSHIPKPLSCEGCHARPATAGLRAYPNQGPPAGFDPNNKASPGSGHYVGKDCAACHNTPNEGATAFTFTHSTPKADFCLPCHHNDGQGEHAGDNAIQLQAFGNCFSCHQNFDRNAARNFGTVGN